MTNAGIRRLEVNGRPATAEDLRLPALVNYGHFTVMQVRDRKVRGLDLHLARLDAANRELFGTGLPVDPDFMTTVTKVYESVPWDSI